MKFLLILILLLTVVGVIVYFVINQESKDTTESEDAIVEPVNMESEESEVLNPENSPDPELPAPPKPIEVSNNEAPSNILKFTFWTNKEKTLITPGKNDMVDIIVNEGHDSEIRKSISVKENDIHNVEFNIAEFKKVRFKLYGYRIKIIGFNSDDTNSEPELLLNGNNLLPANGKIVARNHVNNVVRFQEPIKTVNGEVVQTKIKNVVRGDDRRYDFVSNGNFAWHGNSYTYYH